MPGEEYKEIVQSLQQQLSYARDENMTLLEQLQQSEESVTQFADEAEYVRKKYAAIQQELTATRNVHERLETQIYGQEQEVVKLRRENQHLAKSKKDLEKKLLEEVQAFENERIRWQQREADLFNQIRSLSVTGENPKSPRRRSINSTMFGAGLTNGVLRNGVSDEINGQPKPLNGALFLSPVDTTNPISPHRHQGVPALSPMDAVREAKIASRTIATQDKLICDLKAEVEKQRAVAQENYLQNQRHAMRIEHLQSEISNVKQLNRSLMEDNESYQILLHEKTMSGEFMLNPIMQTDRFVAENALSFINVDDDHTRKFNITSQNGLNLAAELNLASVSSSQWEAVQKESETNLMVGKLSEEIKNLKDENKALTLYINKILVKIMANKQLEDVLSIDTPDPVPAQPKPQSKVTTLPAPVPNSTRSASFFSEPMVTRPRRKTISSPIWGPRNAEEDNNQMSINTSMKPKVNGHQRSPSDMTYGQNKSRRHNSISSGSPFPNDKENASRGSNGSWAKAFKRMSGIGWSSNNTPAKSNEVIPEVNGLAEMKGKESVIPVSGSSTLFHRSGEVDVLGTLVEEER